MTTLTPVVAESRAVLVKHARSFSLASVFLPPDAGDDAAVVYALCRLIDDTVDEAPDAAIADIEAGQLRAELLGDAPARPLVAGFLAVMARRGGDVAPAIALLDGVRDDLAPARVADDAELVRYGYRVASTVGLLMCAVIGVTDRQAWPHAIDLGVAMQLTNICRDVAEDAGMGRVYLPASRLSAVGVSQAQLIDGTADPAAVSVVVRDLLEVADRYYASADAGMAYIPVRARAAILVASRVYRAIGVKLRRYGCDPLRGRTVVPWWEKVAWVAVGLGAVARLAIMRSPPHDSGLHLALAGLPGVHAQG